MASDIGVRESHSNGQTTWTILNPYAEEIEAAGHAAAPIDVPVDQIRSSRNRPQPQEQGAQVLFPPPAKQSQPQTKPKAAAESTEGAKPNRGGYRSGSSSKASKPPSLPKPVYFGGIGSATARFFKSFKASNDVKASVKNKFSKVSSVEYAHWLAQRNGISKSELLWTLATGGQGERADAGAAAGDDDGEGDADDQAAAAVSTSSGKGGKKPRISSVLFSGKVAYAEDSDSGPSVKARLVGFHAPTNVTLTLARDAAYGKAKIPSLSLEVARTIEFAAITGRSLSFAGTLRLNSDPKLTAAEALGDIDAVCRVSAKQTTALANASGSLAVSSKSYFTVSGDVLFGLVRAYATQPADPEPAEPTAPAVTAATHLVVLGLSARRQFGGAGIDAGTDEPASDEDGSEELATAAALADGESKAEKKKASVSTGNLSGEARLAVLDRDAEVGLFATVERSSLASLGLRGFVRFPSLPLSVYGQIKVPVGESALRSGSSSSGKAKSKDRSSSSSTSSAASASGSSRKPSRSRKTTEAQHASDPTVRPASPVRSDSASAEPGPAEDGPSAMAPASPSRPYQSSRKPPPASPFDGVFPLVGGGAAAEMGVEYAPRGDARAKAFVDTNGRAGAAFAAKIGKALSLNQAAVVNLAKLRSSGGVSLGISISLCLEL